MRTRILARPLRPSRSASAVLSQGPADPSVGSAGPKRPSQGATFMAMARRMHTVRDTYVRRGDAARRRAHSA